MPQNGLTNLLCVLRHAHHVKDVSSCSEAALYNLYAAPCCSPSGFFCVTNQFRQCHFSRGGSVISPWNLLAVFDVPEDDRSDGDDDVGRMLLESGAETQRISIKTPCFRGTRVSVGTSGPRAARVRCKEGT